MKKKFSEDRIFDLATGAVDPSKITDDERDTLVEMFSNPDVDDVEVITRIHMRAQGDIDAIDEEIKTLKEIKAALKKAQENAEEAMLRYCENEINTRVTKNFSYSIKESKSAAIIDETLIPQEYLKEKVTVEVDKRLILNDLKLDKDIPGASIQVNKKVNFKENGGY